MARPPWVVPASVVAVAYGLAAWSLLAHGRGPEPGLTSSGSPARSPGPPARNPPVPYPTLVPVPWDGVVAGRLTDASGSPVRDVGVTLRGEGRLPTGCSAEPDGRFRIAGGGGRPGPMRGTTAILGSRPVGGLVAAERVVEIPPVGEIDVGDVVLGEPADLEVRVSRPDGRPVPGAEVALLLAGSRSAFATAPPDPRGPRRGATADASGLATIPGVAPGPALLEVSGAGLGTRAVAVDVPARGRAAVEVALEPGTPFQGTVVGTIPGAATSRVLLVPAAAPPRPDEGWPVVGAALEAPVTPAGTFEFPAAPGGAHRLLMVGERRVDDVGIVVLPLAGPLPLARRGGFPLGGTVRDDLTDAPVARAAVLARADLGAGAATFLLAFTDEHGRFRLDEVPACAPLRLVVRRDGWSRHVREWCPVPGTLEAPSAPVEVRLRRTASVAGTAIDLDGAPLPGARVGAWEDGDAVPWDRPLATAIADGDGRYALAGLPAEAVLLRAWLEGAAAARVMDGPAPHRVDLGPGEEATQHVLAGAAPEAGDGERADAEGAAAESTGAAATSGGEETATGAPRAPPGPTVGLVVNDTGVPVPGASVFVLPGPPRTGAARGMSLARGVAFAPLTARPARPLLVGPNVTIAYAAPWSQGEPVLPAEALPDATTDATGRFVLDGLPAGRVGVAIAAPGHAAAEHVISAGSTSAAVVLRRRRPVAGVVLMPDGHPAAGASVAPGVNGQGLLLAGAATVEPDGRFLIPDAGAFAGGAQISVAAAFGRGPPWTAVHARANVGDTNLRVVLPAMRVLHGEVTDAAARPWSGVTWSLPSGLPASAVTDARGRLGTRGLAHGGPWYVAFPGDAAPRRGARYAAGTPAHVLLGPHTADDGSAWSSFVVPTGVPLRGHLLDAEGRPLRGLRGGRVDVVPLRVSRTNARPPLRADLRPDGSFTTDALDPAETYRIEVSGIEGHVLTAIEPPPPGEAARVEVRLSAGRTLHGVLRDSSGAPVGAGVPVSADPFGDERDLTVTGVTGADGSFALPALPERELRLTAGGGASTFAQATLVVRGGGDVVMNLAPECVVQGRVLLGKARPGVARTFPSLRLRGAPAADPFSAAPPEYRQSEGVRIVDGEVMEFRLRAEEGKPVQIVATTLAGVHVLDVVTPPVTGLEYEFPPPPRTPPPAGR